MPELPEVETVARRIKPDVVGKTIRSATVRWERTVATPSAKQFAQQIKGQKILDVSRRAKYVVIHLSDFHLLVHLRMSGDLIVRDAGKKAEKHDRLILTLTPNPSPSGRGELSLAFNDTRKFGRVWLLRDPQDELAKLGPEPLSKAFTPQWLYAALQQKKRQLKPLLLDQTFLAGMGNIYTDEALNIAKLHPQAVAARVTKKQAEALHEAIRLVLKEGIKRNGASIDWMYRGGEFQHYFRAYDRTGHPCQNCCTPIKHTMVGQRSTHYCPTCQRLK